MALLEQLSSLELGHGDRGDVSSPPAHKTWRRAGRSLMPRRPRPTTLRPLDTSCTTEEGTGGESHPEVRPSDSVDAHAPQDGLRPRDDSGDPVSVTGDYDHLRPRADSGVSVSDDDDYDHDYDIASSRTYADEDEGAVADDSAIDEGHAPQERGRDSARPLSELYATPVKFQKPSAPSHPTEHDDDEPTYATATAKEEGRGDAAENNGATKQYTYEVPVPVSRPRSNSTKLTNTQPNTPAVQQSPDLTSDPQPDAPPPTPTLAASTANSNPPQCEQPQALRAAPTPKTWTLILATTTTPAAPSPPGESTEQAPPIPPIPPTRSSRPHQPPRTPAHFGFTPTTASHPLSRPRLRTHQTFSSQSAAANANVTANGCYTCVGRYWGTVNTGLPFPGSEAFAPQDDRPVRQLIIQALEQTVRGMTTLKVDRRCKAQPMTLTVSGDGTLKAIKSKTLGCIEPWSDAADLVDNRHIIINVCESTSLLYHFHDVVVQRGCKKRRVAVLLCKNPITATIDGHVLYLKDGRSAALRSAIRLAQKQAFDTTDA